MAREDRPLHLLSMTWRNLIRQRVRTSLTVIGVSVGVVAIVAFGAIVRGFWTSTDAFIHTGDTDLMVFQSGVAADLFSTLDEAQTRDALAVDPDVAESAAYLWHILPVEDMPFTLVVGLHPDEFSYRDQQVVRGHRARSDDEVTIGTIVERTLGKRVGDNLSLGGRSHRIVGVFHTGVVFFDGAVYLTMDRLQDLIRKPGQATSFQVRLRSGADPRAVADRIERDHPHLAAIGSAEEYKKVDQGLEVADGMVWAVSVMALLVGGLIVLNTMWMSVYERTREIGVLRAVGWSRKSVMAMIVLESFGVALIACVLGCVCGVGLAQLSANLPVATQFLDPVFEPSLFGLALAVAVLLSVLGGALPAWRAARISPVEALRHE